MVMESPLPGKYPWIFEKTNEELLINWQQGEMKESIKG